MSRILLAGAAALLGVAFGLPAHAEEQDAKADGIIQGRVVDAANQEPIAGVTVTVVPSDVVRVTDAQGGFEFETIPAGTYAVRAEKSAYRDSTQADVVVRPHQMSRADFAILAQNDASGPDAGPSGIEEFVVLAPPAGEIIAASRMDADELINTLNAEELSKFAASDVADALRFVPGVNVVGGQFAVIRGLEDRYNATLYNFAPIPSPDPNSQSVQLDLFPSDVVSNLIVSKTFLPDSPSNTSGGLTNIITHDYPEDLEIKLSLGAGFEYNAWQQFIEYQDDSPVGKEISGWDTAETDFGVSVGGRRDFFDHEFRFKGILNQEIDYETAQGWVEGREPAPAVYRRFPRPGRIVESADLSLGELSLSDGRYDLTESQYTKQGTGYFGFGVDLDEDGDHTLDASLFYTKVDEEFVSLESNGYLPDFDYSTLAALQEAGREVTTGDFDGYATLGSRLRSVRSDPNDSQSRGPLWFASFGESESFKRERDLLVYQLNGDHTVSQVPGLHFSWAGNQAKTSQKETSFGSQFFYEPNDTTKIPTTFPTTPESLGEGLYYANNDIFYSTNDVHETQDFGRLDADYETTFFHDIVTMKISTGGWYERAKRDVESSFLLSPTVGGSSQFALSGKTPQELGESILEELDTDEDDEISGLLDTTNDAKREIKAWNLGSKTTLFEQLDLLAGFRLESIYIDSRNDPFTGEDALDGSPGIFPTKYLFFDRLDNPARNEVTSAPPPGTVFNDEILGIDVPVDATTGLVDLADQSAIEELVNGEIDKNYFLPSFGLAYRPLEGLSLRGAFSQTVARPSFREMGFYVSVEPGTDDLIVGNPQLGLSEVTSYDTRAEYTWGDFGDLVAVSAFKKSITTPIESIIIRNPLNLDSSNALFRTFFNNPNKGSIRGLEFEARKAFDFIPLEYAQYFSVGGNYTLIDAKVNRTEAELARSQAFFGVAPGDTERFTELEVSRRLFGQPEWIANIDLSFDQPEWGTKITLAYFAISDVLDAAGSASINPDGSIRSFVPDRYLRSYGQLDLIVSQSWYIEAIKGDITVKASIKNLTDSTRGYIYDTNQTNETISEREFRVGRDFAFSLTYTF